MHGLVLPIVIQDTQHRMLKQASHPQTPTAQLTLQSTMQQCNTPYNIYARLQPHFAHHTLNSLSTVSYIHIAISCQFSPSILPFSSVRTQGMMQLKRGLLNHALQHNTVTHTAAYVVTHTATHTLNAQGMTQLQKKLRNKYLKHSRPRKAPWASV